MVDAIDIAPRFAQQTASEPHRTSTPSPVSPSASLVSQVNELVKPKRGIFDNEYLLIGIIVVLVAVILWLLVYAIRLKNANKRTDEESDDTSAGAETPESRVQRPRQISRQELEAEQEEMRAYAAAQFVPRSRVRRRAAQVCTDEGTCAPPPSHDEEETQQPGVRIEPINAAPEDDVRESDPPSEFAPRTEETEMQEVDTEQPEEVVGAQPPTVQPSHPRGRRGPRK